MERLMRLREPMTVIALVGVALHLALSVLWATRYPEPLGPAFASLATLVIPPVLLGLSTGLLVSCWLTDPTPNARSLTVAGLVLTAASLLGVVISAVLSFTTARGVDGTELAFLPWLVAPVTVAVISLIGQVGLLRRTEPTAVPAPEPLPAPVEPEPDPQLEPTWTSDAAVGTVWRRAGDAGSQRPATSWDAPDQSGGWRAPEQVPDPQVEPTRRSPE